MKLFHSSFLLSILLAALCPNNFTNAQTSPTLVCQNATLIVNAQGSGSLEPAAVFNAAQSVIPEGMTYNLSLSPNAFSCAGGYLQNTVLTLEYEGGSTTCNASVTIVDKTPPSVVCKNHTVVLTTSGNVFIQPSDVCQSKSDACSNVNLNSVVPNSFNCNKLGANTVTLFYSDNNGNKGNCQATVSVTDGAAPTISTCPSNITVDSDPGVCTSSAVPSGGIGASDNCQIASVVNNAPNPYPLGTTTVIYTVTDFGGNSSTCSRTVTVYNPDTDGDEAADCFDNCLTVPNSGQDDHDCDGLGNACDECPGGDDAVDNNLDGLPDCKYPPALEDILPEWFCGVEKIYMAHKIAAGGYTTICVPYAAMAAHMAHGDYLGPANAADCSNGAKPAGAAVTDRSDRGSLSTALEVFPNPAHDMVNIHLHGMESTSVQLTLTDQLGKTVWLQSVDASEFVLNITGEGIQNGIYFLTAVSDGERMTKRLVIAR